MQWKAWSALFRLPQRRKFEQAAEPEDFPSGAAAPTGAKSPHHYRQSGPNEPHKSFNGIELVVGGGVPKIA
jgi:hypothetical protein